MVWKVTKNLTLIWEISNDFSRQYFWKSTEEILLYYRLFNSMWGEKLYFLQTGWLVRSRRRTIRVKHNRKNMRDLWSFSRAPLAGLGQSHQKLRRGELKNALREGINKTRREGERGNYIYVYHRQDISYGFIIEVNFKGHDHPEIQENTSCFRNSESDGKLK